MRAHARVFSWRPSDSPNVIAWFEGENASASSWVSTVGAASAAQATGANQPTVNPTGMNGLPGLDFDGSNDFMEVTGLSAAVGNVMVCAALRPLARIAADATLFDTATGRLLIFTDSAATGDDAGWYDGAYKDATAPLATSVVQIVCWDLRAAPGGRIFVNGSQIGSTQAYTQRAIGSTVTIGADVGLLGANGYRGRLGDLIVATGQDDTLRSQLTSYLSSKYNA